MKILINGYNLRGFPVGIANVIINFVNSLSETTLCQIEIAVQNDLPDCISCRLNKTDNIKISRLKAEDSLFWLFFTFPTYLKKSDADYVWFPSPVLPLIQNKKIKSIVTVHDFVSKDFRSTMTIKGRLISRFVEPRTIKKCDYIWCVSEYTKNRLIQLYPNVKNKVVCNTLSPDRNFSKLLLSKKVKESFKAKYLITKPFLLFVGSIEPRKNLGFLLNVFENFHKNHDFQLVIVGARHWGQSDLTNIINRTDYPKKDVLFLEYVSEEDLCYLYNLAECYVSTSLNEGFGLPQTEAMACGCPVVCSHNSAMIEVVYGAGVTVEGWDIDKWTESIDSVILKKEEIIRKQSFRLSSFSWNRIVNLFIKNLGL